MFNQNSNIYTVYKNELNFSKYANVYDKNAQLLEEQTGGGEVLLVQDKTNEIPLIPEPGKEGNNLAQYEHWIKIEIMHPPIYIYILHFITYCKTYINFEFR